MTLKKRPDGSLVSTFELTRANRSDSRSAPLLTPLALLLLGAVQMARAQTERSQADQTEAAGRSEAAGQSAAAAAEQLQLNWDEPAVQAEAAPVAELPAELLALLQAVADAARQSAAAEVGEGASTDAAQAAPAQEPGLVAAEDRLGQMDRAEAVLEAYQNVIDQLPADLVLAQAPAAGAEAAAAGGISTGAMLAGLLGLVALGAGGGGGGSGSGAAPAAAATTDITLHDGYIDGADVYVDLNDNGRVDVGVDKLLGQTKNGGKLSAVLTDADKLHGLIAQGGTDISTNSDFIGSFSTTAGSTVINPLSTLVQTLVQSTIGTLSGLSAADREAALKEAKASAISTVSTALGIESDVDLTQIDTVKASSGTTEITVGFDSADAIDLHSKALMVANMISVGAATLAGAAGDADATANLSKFVVQGIVNSISSAASSGEAVSFKSADSVTQILNTAVDAAKQSGQSLDDTVVSNATANVAGAVAATNQLINAFAGEAAKAVAAATPGNAAAAATSGLTQMLQAQKVVNNQIDGLKSADSATLTQLNALGDVTQVQAQARQVTSGLKVGTTTVAAITEAPTDLTAPTVTSVDVRPARVGDLAHVVVKMSEPVLVKVGENGRPTLTVTTSAVDAQSPTTATAQYEPGLSSGDNLVFTYRVQAGDVRVSVASGASITLPTNTTITDLAANNAVPGIATSASVSVDSIAPTVAISSNLAFVKAGATATVTFTVSEAVSTRAANAFTAEDVTVKNGVLTEFKKSADSPNVYTAKLAATNAAAPAEIGVAGGKFTDLAGNGNLPSNVVLLAQEGAAPVVAISADRNFFNTANTPQGNSPSTALKFSLSADSTDFTAEDVVITGGGELSNFQGSGKDYTATITGMTSATKVSVAKDTFSVTGTSAKNIASNELGFKVDVVKPTVTLSLLKGATGTDAVTETTVLKAGESARVSFTVSEDVVGFGPQSIKVVGGFLEGFAPDKSGPNKFSAVFKPAAPQPGQTGPEGASITVMDGRFADTAGNTNTGTSASFRIDNTRPMVTGVTDNTQGAAKAGASVVYTYSFNKPVSGLEPADFEAANGDVTSVSPVALSVVVGSGASSSVYTQWNVAVTPKAGVAAGNIGLTLKSGAVTDPSGNTNLEHKQAIQAIDTVAPTAELELSRSTYLKASPGSQAMTGDLTIKFSEPVQSIVQGAFTVTGAGGTVGMPAKVGTDGRVWKATFTPAAGDVAGEVQVKLAAGSYTDAAGNPGGAADSAAVRTNVVAPVLTITADKTVLRTSDANTTVTFAFSEAVKDFDRSDVTVTGGTLGALTNVDSKTWTAVFTPSGSTPSTAKIAVADDKFASTADNIKGIGDELDLKTNQTNPSLAIAMTEAKADGTLVFGIEASDPAVTGLSSSGFTATNGTVGTLQPVPSQAGKFTLTVTPLASGDVVVSAKEGAGSTDLPTLASSSAPAKVILGTSSGETLDLTTTREVVVTGGGNDIIRITDVAQSPATAADLIAGVAKGDKLDISALINKAETTQQYFALVDTRYPGPAPTGWLKVIEDTAALGTPGDNELRFKEEVRSDGSMRLSFVYDTNSATGTTAVSQSVGIGFLAADQAAFEDFMGATPTDYVIADKIAPTMSVSIDKAAFAKGATGTAQVTFTTNEFIGQTFSQVNVVGGSISTPVQSQVNPLVWTATFTPTSNPDITSGSISVAARAYVDMVGNEGLASNTQSLVLNAVAPVLSLEVTDVTASGQLVFELASDQALTGLTASDFEGSGYTVNSLTPVAGSAGKVFEVTITPTASGNLAFSLPAGAAAGAVLPTPAVSSTDPAVIQVIKSNGSGTPIEISGAADRLILLGAGNETVQINSVGTPVAGEDTNVLAMAVGVSPGDKFDVSRIFSAYSGFVAAAKPDPQDAFVTIANLKLTQNPATETDPATTLVTFDVMIDASTVNSSRINGITLDLAYDATSLVADSMIVSPRTYPVTSTRTADLLDTIVVNQDIGKIAATSTKQSLFNTYDIADPTGKVLSVEFTLDKLVDFFEVGFDNSPVNALSLVSGTAPELITGSSKVAFASGTALQADILQFVVNSSTNTDELPALPQDNQVQVIEAAGQAGGFGTLKFQYDTNPAVGTVTRSPVVELELISSDLSAFFNSDYVKLI